MPVPFWDVGAQGVLSILPDVSAQNRVSEQFAWVVVYLAGRRIPGRSLVKFRRGHRVDTKKANGSDGATITHLGFDPGEISIRTKMWSAQQLADFAAMIPYIQPRLGKGKPPTSTSIQGVTSTSSTPPAQGRPLPVSAEHPVLAMWGVKRLFIMSIAGPEETSTPQVFETTFTCQEHEPQVNVGALTLTGLTIADSQNQQTPAAAKAPSPSKSQNAAGPNLGQ